jgi:large subunit ribosomal protein L19e
MPLKQQRMIAAQLMKCGVSRVRFKSESEVAEALTRDDIRKLIVKGVIYKIQKKGTSRGHAREILRQKKRGRRRGAGSIKGKWGSRNPAKEQWMNTIRPLRRLLSELRDSGQLTRKDYRMLYRKAKGGAFRSRKHMMLHIKEEELLNKGSTPAERTAAKAKLKEKAKTSTPTERKARKTKSSGGGTAKTPKAKTVEETK